ncbi:monocarboxylate transporter [Echinococcus multilocularis]|uniref:Monocarboxylate transporter n=1 Tax=Echinococcus multilocularis TaxID=6211 RepID=A0A068Y482_ECHMU|nr:monocarboxylate transporter [Echinococcus multilocularis]
MVQCCPKYLQEKGCSVRHTLTLIGALLTCFCVDGCAYNIGILISYWSSYFNKDTFVLSWIGSIQMFFSYCLGPLTGFLINHFGITPVAITGATVASMGHFISGMHGNMITLYICFGALAGAGYGLLYMTAIVAITTGFDELRPIAMGIMACGSGIGASIHSIFYPLVESKVTWKGLCIATAGLLLQTCVFGCLLGLALPKKPPQQPMSQSPHNPTASIFSLDSHALGILGSGYLNRPNEPTTNAAFMNSQLDLKVTLETPKMQHMMGSLGSFTYLVEVEKIAQQIGLFGKGMPLHRNASFLVFLAAVFIQAMGSYSPVILLFDILLAEGLSPKAAAGTTALVGISSAIARLVFGTLATFRWVNKTHLLSVLMMAGGAINITVFFLHQQMFLQFYACVIGICLVQRERLTDAMGWEIMSAGMGYCLSTPLATLLSLQLGNMHISYIVSGVLMLFGGTLVELTRWSRRTISEADINRLRRRLEGAAG